MNFSPKCRTNKLGMMYTILESFRSFFNWERADIWPQTRPRKIPVLSIIESSYEILVLPACNMRAVKAQMSLCFSHKVGM